MIGFGQKKDKFTKDIKEKYDKFEGSTKWHSPFYGKGIRASVNNTIVFIKTKENNVYKTYVYFTTFSVKLTTSNSGAIVLFEDGYKMEFPLANVGYGNAKGSLWKYFSKIRINEEELNKFITTDVEAIRISNYSNDIKRKKEKINTRGWAKAIKETF
tara:strand:- start:8 stop:478 length:471 start_codon:yes stop_codon:yes gene_type:complete